jgi:putative MATE family efflux protein
VNQPARPPGRPGVFTQGSILRHVLVMTFTGSIGLMSIFVVDLLSLIYISRLGDPNVTAGVGYAAQIGFFLISLSIGLLIAIGALTSRAIGGGDRMAARRIATSGLVHVAWITGLISLALFPLREQALMAMGASGQPLEVGSRFLAITLPSTAVLSVGMALSSVLRAVGDARRAMFVTLGGAIMTAIADPILIFGLGLGADGAAIATVMSRFMFLVVGLHGAFVVHRMLARPERRAVMRDLAPLMAIALPAIATNLAPPFANAYALRIFSEFGEQAVAAWAIIDRIIPVAYGVLFAMSGAVGPIMGQNFGAGRTDRLRETLVRCFQFSILYSALVWALTAAGAPLIVRLFGADGETARLVVFFCLWGGAAWMALGCLFVANTAFNNLGFPIYSTLFNWGRATLGTVPFVWFGARYGGPEGAQAGIFIGAVLFGVVSVVVAFRVTRRLATPPPIL